MEPPPLGTTDYGSAPTQCTPGSRPGPSGYHNDLRTAHGIEIRVRTPANYDAARAHPLLVVYAAAGHSALRSEQFTGLTTLSTEAGYIVAYVGHRRLSAAVIDELASVPALISTRWCIDERRLFMTGHSDGGTTAAAMSFRPHEGLRPRGIATSAAGVNADHLKDYACPSTSGVMVIHNRDDRLFPDYGASLSQWFADCAECTTRVELPNDCTQFQQCNGDRTVLYCRNDGGHTQWPPREKAIIDFFSDVDDMP